MTTDTKVERVFDALLNKPRFALALLKRLRSLRYAGPWHQAEDNESCWIRKSVGGHGPPYAALVNRLIDPADGLTYYKWTGTPNDALPAIRGETGNLEEAQAEADQVLSKYHLVEPNRFTRWLLVNEP